MTAIHPALKRHANHAWRDVHCSNDEVRCTRYEVVPRPGSSVKAHLAEVGGAVQAVLSDAFATNQLVRVGGGCWSLSNIARRGDLPSHGGDGRGAERYRVVASRR